MLRAARTPWADGRRNAEVWQRGGYFDGDDPRCHLDPMRTRVPIETGRRASVRGRLYMMVRAERLPDPLWAYDIGLGGLKVESRWIVFPGTYLDLSFRLPGTRELLKVGAQVATLGDAPGNASGT